MAKKILIIQKQGPYSSIQSSEGLELSLLAASFELAVAIIFMDDGLWQLLKDQNPHKIYGKIFSSTIKALPKFNIDNIYVEHEAMRQRQLKTTDFSVKVEIVTHHERETHTHPEI